jgi:hypothetical protein
VPAPPRDQPDGVRHQPRCHQGALLADVAPGHELHQVEGRDVLRPRKVAALVTPIWGSSAAMGVSEIRRLWHSSRERRPKLSDSGRQLPWLWRFCPLRGRGIDRVDSPAGFVPAL